MPLMVGNPRKGVQQPKMAKFIKSSQPWRTPNLIWNYQTIFKNGVRQPKTAKKLLKIHTKKAYA